MPATREKLLELIGRLLPAVDHAIDDMEAMMVDAEQDGEPEPSYQEAADQWDAALTEAREILASEGT